MKYHIISPNRDFRLSVGAHVYRMSEEAILDTANEGDYVHVVEVTTFKVVSAPKLQELN